MVVVVVAVEGLVVVVVVVVDDRSNGSVRSTMSIVCRLVYWLEILEAYVRSLQYQIFFFFEIFLFGLLKLIRL